ncbi:MAG: hypothetical protein NUW01_09020 [Gemmatimonadaceae bacterium]|nr:hypothetical protein [Gemmatimonadaceae bacterium]
MTIRYTAIKRPQTAKAKPKTLHHEWRCDLCDTVVHTELVTDLTDEDTMQALARTERIKGATESHVCPKSDTED